MRKMPPELVRGREAEQRFVSIARSLQETTTWLKKVTYARSRLDASGVDVVALIEPLSAGGYIKIPIQIKSSKAGVRHYQVNRPDCMEAGVIIVVVNELRTCESIKDDFLLQLTSLRERQVDFTQFFRRIASKFAARA
jgi:hypothetical protein